MSPLVKREAYAPALTGTLEAASTRVQQQQHRAGGTGLGAGPLGGGGGRAFGLPVAQPGDLFEASAVASAWAQRPTGLQYLVEPPEWDMGRPRLTGLDIIKVRREWPVLQLPVAVPL